MLLPGLVMGEYPQASISAQHGQGRRLEGRGEGRALKQPTAAGGQHRPACNKMAGEQGQACRAVEESPKALGCGAQAGAGRGELRMVHWRKEGRQAGRQPLLTQRGRQAVLRNEGGRQFSARRVAHQPAGCD